MIKLEKHNKRKVVYENETYSINGKKNIKLCVSKQNGKVVDYTIYSNKPPYVSKEENKYGKEYFPYYYFLPSIFDEFKIKHYTEIKFKNFIIPFDQFKDDKEIDLDRVLCPYHGGHMVFGIKDLSPIPTVMWFDYVGGIENEHFYIDKALEHLKKNKFVLEVEKEEIPYYNATNNHTHGLNMKVLLSDAIFKTMWNHVKKSEFPTVRMKELVCCHYMMSKKIDPLGIRKFIKPDKVVKEEHKEEEQDEENQ